MNTYTFTIKKEVSIDEALEELTRAGVKILYSSETVEGAKEIFGNAPAELVLESVEKMNMTPLSPIDWESQWSSHGLDYHDGYVHVAVGLKTIRLLPGPGFGDLSHPTTRLLLKMMVPYVAGAHVLDIGSGSGILSLAAASMGALSVHGIDIDKEAIWHAQENAALNDLEVTFGLPEDYNGGHTSLVILMNMITSEQEVAWDSLKVIHDIPGHCFISGVLEDQVEEYVIQAKKRGWILQEAQSEEGWVALHFIIHKLIQKLGFYQEAALNLRQAKPARKAAQLEKVEQCRGS